jgi:peptidoglycan/LPS O-acetylase OafA/YrhL
MSESMNSANDHHKLYGINGIRALSILMVIACHLNEKYSLFYAGFKGFSWIQPFEQLFTDGQFGVNVFFVISGFLITYLLLIEESRFKTISIKNFFIRRTLRIFPAYLFLLLFYFVLQIAGWIKISPESWLTSLTYTKYFNYKLDWYTAHAWSLSVEEQFYLLWPFIFLLGNKIRKNVAIGFVLLVPFIRIYLARPDALINHLSFFGRMDSIALGCLCALYKDSLWTWIQPRTKILFFFSLFIILSIRYLPNAFNKLHFGYDFPITMWGNTYGTFSNFAIGIILLITVYGSHGLWFKFLNHPILDRLGLYSYSIYLWQQFFLNNTGLWYNKVPLNLLFIALFSLGSYYLIEKPFLKLKSKFTSPVKVKEYANQEPEIQALV